MLRIVGKTAALVFVLWLGVGFILTSLRTFMDDQLLGLLAVLLSVIALYVVYRAVKYFQQVERDRNAPASEDDEAVL